MTIAACDHCQELNLKVPVRTPAELEKAIRVIDENIRDGTIRESAYRPEGILDCRNGVPFSALSNREAWGDAVVYYFECVKCGRLYHLSVETYHGRGGCWAPLDME